jgi:hypothetical protein
MLATRLIKRPRRGWTWEVRDDDTGKLMARVSDDNFNSSNCGLANEQNCVGDLG